MELTMASQRDASPWTIPSPNPITPPPPPPNPEEASSSASRTTATATPTSTLPGRGYFSQLGIVRRKPSRGDAPPSLSKSCSDKIAQKQCTSLLCSLVSLLISPHNIYLSSLVLPKDQFFEGACRRCFSADGSSTAGGGDDVDSKNSEINAGRMRPLAGRRWGHDYGCENGEEEKENVTGRRFGSYAFVPFRVETTTREFGFSKRAVATRTDKTSASHLAVAWTRDGLEEGLIGGMLQGRKQFSPRGASAVSRRGMWKMAREVAALLEDGEGDRIRSALDVKTYDEVKGAELLDGRRAVKTEVRREALKGWLPNTGDGAFTLQ
jgi:tRNA-specific adenosine deaminase 1